MVLSTIDNPKVKLAKEVQLWKAFAEIVAAFGAFIVCNFLLLVNALEPIKDALGKYTLSKLAAAFLNGCAVGTVGIPRAAFAILRAPVKQAEPPDTEVQLGNQAVVNLVQLVKALAPIYTQFGALIETNWGWE